MKLGIGNKKEKILQYNKITTDKCKNIENIRNKKRKTENQRGKTGNIISTKQSN